MALTLLVSGCATSGGNATSRRVNTDLSTQQTVPEPNAKTLYAMSRLLMGQGKEAEAELVLLKVLAIHPQFALARADLAELYMGQGRVEEAAEQLDQALEVVSGDPVLLNNAGVCALFLGHYEEALDRFEAASAVVPHDSRYRANQALALGLMGNMDASRQVYLQVLSPAEVEHNLGVIHAMRIARGLAPLNPAALAAPRAEVTSGDVLSMTPTMEKDEPAEAPAQPAPPQQAVRVSEEAVSPVPPAEQVVLAPVAPEAAPARPVVVTVAPAPETESPSVVPQEPAVQERAAEQAAEVIVVQEADTAQEPAAPTAQAEEAAEQAAAPETPVQKREPGSVMPFKASAVQEPAVEQAEVPVEADVEAPVASVEQAIEQREVIVPSAETALEAPVQKREPGSVMPFKASTVQEPAVPESAVAEPVAPPQETREEMPRDGYEIVDAADVE